MIFLESITRKQSLEMLTVLYEAGARVHHFNGSQWYVEVNPKMVMVFDTSLENDMPQIRLNEDAEDYLTSNSNTYDVRDDNGRQFDFERLLGYYTIEN